MFGRGTYSKDFGKTDPMEIYKAKAYAAFELMNKLDIDYFCFHDRDISPEAETLAETNARWMRLQICFGAMKRTENLCGGLPTVSTTHVTCTAQERRPVRMCLPCGAQIKSC